MENKKKNNDLFNIENYNVSLSLEVDKIINRYKDIINEYLFHAVENIIIQNSLYYIFVLKRGLDTLNHIFNTLLLYTKNVDMTTYHCKKAYLYYVEFIGQIGDTTHSYLQLNSKDATLFVYKKTIFEINNEYRKSFVLTKDEKELFKYISNTTKLFNEIMLYLLDNDHFQEDSRLSYIMYIQKMMGKILMKYNTLNLSMKNKIQICKLYLYYKNLILSKKVINECKFLNLTLLFLKKMEHKKITQAHINEKMYHPESLDKLKHLTPLKFTNWLFSSK